ncbi:thiamine-phosphate kinase [Methylococcus sp. EFPC2]|uniref:thiamine-phosphate kinase n=1 Tax=Methylococcus sp. EFPC2 TaxID=2812648 RepID=UPI001967AB67|nr:thiamine-phosphate kinase [Methylococcus sp. EFPC2]QSA97678.1 thiamine-phosphate kinase [Methylococcus sp. EFPC2]
MSLGEFELIRRYFTRPPRRADTLLTVGDDCALLVPRADERLAVSTDTLVAGVHFLADTDPRRLGHKCLAVNLSDLAAMGADPAWVTLALTLPRVDEAWLERFAEGFLDLAQRYGVDLIGGDTTHGPLSITVQAMGWVSADKALRRDGARAGDAVYMTGELGLGGLGLRIALGKCAIDAPAAVERLEKPEPRISAGLALGGLASACIDISDGLAADLGHILTASGVGATLDYAALPLPEPVRRHVEETGDWSMPLTAGDDYELCFTLAPEHEAELAARGISCTRIGHIEAERGLRILRDGQRLELGAGGYRHF